MILDFLENFRREDFLSESYKGGERELLSLDSELLSFFIGDNGGDPIVGSI